MALPKTYRTVARLGAVSTTGDPEGEITETGRRPGTRPELPTGEVLQRPPAYSAVKVGGERAYRRARRGEEVEMPPRQVTVHRFERALARGGPGRVRDRVLVGHLRPQPDRGPRRRLLPRAAADRDRPVRRGRGRGGRAQSRSPTRSRASAARDCESSAADDDRGHPAARRKAAPAPGRDRHLRRRPRRPPQGDRGRRHGADLRAAPGEGDRARGRAEADHAVQRRSAT